MQYNFADFQANASSTPAYVLPVESHGHVQDGHDFFGSSSETGREPILSWYRNGTMAAVSKLRRLFIFCDDSVITNFFAHHSGLADWLVRGQTVLAKHFAADTQFMLKPAHHAAGDDYPQFVVYIQTRLPVAEATARLDAFAEEWLLGQIDFIGNKIIFNLAPI